MFIIDDTDPSIPVRDLYVMGALRQLESRLKRSFLGNDWGGVHVLRDVSITLDHVESFLQQTREERE